MSTWHQRKRPVPLWHKTKWTVVTDPPDNLQTVARFSDQREAEAYAARVPHSYVLTPEIYRKQERKR